MTEDVAKYMRRLPVIAAWSLEKERHAVVFFQVRGNEVRIIGSRLFELFEPLSIALEHVKNSFPWKHCDTHVLPAATSPGVAELFEDAGFEIDMAPECDDFEILAKTRELFSVLAIDRQPRDWLDEEENNMDLVESLNGYRAEEVAKRPGAFSPSPVRTWERHLVLAFEAFAGWWHDGGAVGWGEKPSNEVYNRGVI